MRNISKIVLIVGILFLIIGTASAVQFKNTADVEVNGNDLKIDGKIAPNFTVYNDTSFIKDVILQDNPIIKSIGDNGANEVQSVSDYNLVYEFLTDHAMYYTFGKDGKTVVVTINEDNWHADMLKKMDKWCLENKK